jgi:hypothetical protein
MSESPAEAGGHMVGVAQMVEHLVVVQDVAGSSPVTHPMRDTPSHRLRTGRVPFQTALSDGAPQQ